MKALTNLSQALLKLSPTLIASVGGCKFYECPSMGEDAPLIAITSEGKKKFTSFYEAPSVDDVMHCLHTGIWN